MKLSDAILKGCEMRPVQSFTNYGVSGGPACVQGAALVGAGIDAHDESVRSLMYETWPWVITELRCPSCGSSLEMSVIGVLFKLNDIHRWTRERIAAWVTTVEPSP